MVRFAIAPKETKFYDLFEKSAANLVVAAEKLADLFENYENVEVKVKEIKALEHQGDAITHRIMQGLHRAFVTPIDREDIARLANRLDDVMDYIEAAGRTAFLYNISKPTDRARELTSIVVRIAYKLNEIMPLLRRRDQFKKILEGCVEVNSLENEADDVDHAALAELFDDTKDASYIIKWREIYDHLERATDRAEDVADVLEAIVLKHA